MQHALDSPLGPYDFSRTRPVCRGDDRVRATTQNVSYTVSNEDETRKDEPRVDPKTLLAIQTVYHTLETQEDCQHLRTMSVPADRSLTSSIVLVL